MPEVNRTRKGNGLSHHIDHVNQERGISRETPGDDTAHKAEQYLNRNDGRQGSNWPLLAGTAGAFALGFALGRNLGVAAAGAAIAAHAIGRGAAQAGRGTAYGLSATAGTAAHAAGRGAKVAGRAARTGAGAAGYAAKAGAGLAAHAAKAGAEVVGHAGGMVAHKVADTAASVARPALRGVGTGLIAAGTSLRGAAPVTRPRWPLWAAIGLLGAGTVAVATRAH